MEIIDEAENIIEEEKRKQNDYKEQIANIDADIEELKETARLAKLRIESYRPYEVDLLGGAYTEEASISPFPPTPCLHFVNYCIILRVNYSV